MEHKVVGIIEGCLVVISCNLFSKGFSVADWFFAGMPVLALVVLAVVEVWYQGGMQ